MKTVSSIIGLSALACSVASFTGCDLGIKLDRSKYREYALIDDSLAIGERECTVLEVDGHPVRRTVYHLADLPQFAVLDPGHHVLIIRHAPTLHTKGYVGEVYTLGGSVEAGKMYIVLVDAGTPAILEETAGLRATLEADARDWLQKQHPSLHPSTGGQPSAPGE